MAISTALAIYFVVWWVVLFTVLPFGVRSQEEHGDYAAGTDPGAPAFHRIGLKLLLTTLISAVVFAIMATVHVNRWVTLDDLATLFGLLR